MMHPFVSKNTATYLGNFCLTSIYNTGPPVICCNKQNLKKNEKTSKNIYLKTQKKTLISFKQNYNILRYKYIVKNYFSYIVCTK